MKNLLQIKETTLAITEVEITIGVVGRWERQTPGTNNKKQESAKKIERGEVGKTKVQLGRFCYCNFSVLNFAFLMKQPPALCLLVPKCGSDEQNSLDRNVEERWHCVGLVAIREMLQSSKGRIGLEYQKRECQKCGNVQLFLTTEVGKLLTIFS